MVNCYWSIPAGQPRISGKIGSDSLNLIPDIARYQAKTQKNKATSFHLGQLKAKLAKLKRELLTPSTGSGGGGAGVGFDVARTGIGSVGFIGCELYYQTWPCFPNFPDL